MGNRGTRDVFGHDGVCGVEMVVKMRYLKHNRGVGNDDGTSTRG